MSAERALIGSCLLYPQNIAKAACRPFHFEDAGFAQIWKTLLDLYVEFDDTSKIDVAVVSDRSRYDIADLAEIAHTGGVLAQDVEAYSNAVIRDHITREVRGQLSDVVRDVDLRGADLVRRLAQIVDGVRLPDKRKPTALRDVLASSIAWIEANMDRHRAGNSVEITTGFPSIDERCAGLPRGMMTVLGARTSIGKTAFMIAMAARMAEDGQRVAFFTLEDSADTGIGTRILSRMSFVSYSGAVRGNIGIHQLQDICKQPDALSHWDVHVIDEPMDFVEDLEQRIYEHTLEHETDVVFVDYAQCLRSRMAGKEQYEQMTAVSKRMKLIAKKTDTALVLASQLNRCAEGEPPQMKHLKGSGSFEQDAHVVFLLHRERGPENFRNAYLDVTKVKHGEPGKVFLEFDPKTASFYEQEQQSGLQ